MGITSLSYLGFLIATLVIYYILPSKCRWVYLLLVSFTYAGLCSEIWLLVYPVVSVLIVWLCTNKMETSKNRKLLLWIAIIATLGVLVGLKYLNLGVYTFNAIAGRVSQNITLLKVFRFLAPVGVSFYTMSLMGYVFDVYYEIAKPEKNYFKLLLFGMYFPLLVSGPIVRYKDMQSELFEAHPFDYRNFTFGFERIIWGLFKVLVISERLAIVVNSVFNDFSQYSGLYIVFATVCYSFRLYTNFSGSMDIVIGASQMLGISLPENFRQPFFSKTIQEFWQRWHITLGAWLKDYILYPVLRTKAFMELPKRLKDKMGKKRAKQVTTFLALIILWFSVGLWHGGAWKYIWGTGLLQCIYIIISELLTPHWNRVKEKLHIDAKAAWFVLFQRVRTFILISIGFLFFNAGSLTDGFKMLGRVITPTKNAMDTSLLTLGIETKDWVVLVAALILLLVVSVLQEKQDVRDMLAKKHIVIRWVVCYALVFGVIIFGYYGPGFNVAEFIYQGF